MNLRRVKALKPFRSLHEGFELEMRPYPLSHGEFVAPKCLVGLNGSGKSNILEFISEAFQFIELWQVHKQQEQFSKRSYDLEFFEPIAFELEYEITESGMHQQAIVKMEGGLKREDSLEVWARFPQNKFNDWVKQEDLETIKALAPRRVIGYSSGMNELISNPFHRLNFKYFEEFKRKVRLEEQESVYQEEVEMDSMFFLDMESNQAVFLANNLLGQPEAKKLLNKRLHIQRLRSFRIIIQRNMENKRDRFPSRFNVYIDQLKNCATAYHEEEKSDKLILDYFVTEATEEAFRRYFRTPMNLFKTLQNLRLLNLYQIQQQSIGFAQRAINVGDALPKVQNDRLNFHITDVLIEKQLAAKPFPYQQLSDGEHQLLHVAGALMLVREPGTLFLLDEPETHFNPDWRSKMISTLNEIIKIQSEEGLQAEQDILLTTHSPFIISDCKRENVYVFARKEGKVAYDHPSIRTYGTSVGTIMQNIFDKGDSISQMAKDELESFKLSEINTIEQIDDVKYKLQSLGESVEKLELLTQLNRISRKLKNEPNNKD